MPNICLVVPTCRENEIGKFLAAWKKTIEEASVTCYVVEDNPSKTFKIDGMGITRFSHLCWKDAPEELLQCINVRSPGCRQIGFWKAYQEGHEVVVTLDDDVRPVEGGNLFDVYYQILTGGLPVWVDPLLNYRSRGYPEKNTGNIQVSFHIGSFLGVPDVDGDTQLKFEKNFQRNPPKYIPRPTIVPSGQIIPVNGGICGWRRELTPYIHYTLWNKELSYRRFDDIWMGIILKKFMDLSGLRMSYGPPFVEHVRASDAVKNAEYEIEGKKWNEVFWEKFNNELKLRNISAADTRDGIYKKISECLLKMDNLWANSEGAAMLKWRSLFK